MPSHPVPSPASAPDHTRRHGNAAYTHPADDPSTREKWRQLWCWLTSDPEAKEEAALESRPDDESVDNDDRSTHLL